MPADISTQNLVAALLLVNDCDVSCSMDVALGRLEGWEIGRDRHFGTERADMRDAVNNFKYSHPITSDPRLSGVNCEDKTLADYIPTMLKFWSVYSNDESSYFETLPLYYETPANSLRYSMPRGAMRSFLHNPSALSWTEIVNFLEENSLDLRSLDIWSRPGSGS